MKKKILSILLCIALCLSVYIPSINAATITVLEADVSAASTGCTMFGVYGTYYTNAGEALARINEIRKEACEAGNVPDPRDSSRMLQPSDYNPLKWSTDLERIARLRAVEGGLCYKFYGTGHKRLNQKIWYSIKSNGIASEGEDLAYNYDKNALDGIEQWYAEKNTWVNGGSGVTGHYTSMIDPDFTYIGLGDFYTSASIWPNTLSAEFSSTSKTLSQDFLPAYSNVMQKIEVDDTYIQDYILDGDDSVFIGDTISLEPRVNLYNSSTSKTIKLWIAEDVTFSSSNTSVATVSSDGIVSGKAKGTTTINAIVNGNVIASKTITVSCNHNKTLVSSIPSSCTKTGINTYSCTKCKEQFEEPIPLAPHNYIYGSSDESGKSTGTCSNCSATIYINPPKNYTIYWNNFSNNTGNTNYYYPYVPSSNPIGSSIKTLLYDIDGDEGYQDFSMDVSDETILQPYMYGSNYAFKVLSTGIVTIDAYPVYNPAIGKTYTLRVGEEGGVSISDANATLSTTAYTYNGSEKKPTVSLTYNGISLENGTDYSISYKNNTNAGTATVEITGKGIFSGILEKDFVIHPCDISTSAVSVSPSSYEYDKTEKKPAVSVKYSNKTLTENTDYTVSYNNNSEIGTGTVTITGINNYSGFVKKEFTIIHSAHVEKTIDAVPATCTQSGLSKGSVCDLCGKTITQQKVIAATGHAWKEPVYTWASDYSSCTASFVCENDSSHTDSADAIVKSKETPSTCSVKGTKTYTATVSFNNTTYTDTKTVDLDINPSAHPEDKIITVKEQDATCETNGHTSYKKCTVCNQNITQPTDIPAKKHSWKQSDITWSSDNSSCTFNFICENDATHKKSINAIITTSTTPSTCSIKGLTVYTAKATFNDKVYTDTKNVQLDLDSSAHPTDKIRTVPESVATCTKDGHSSYTICDACNTNVTEPEIYQATGHNYVPTYSWSDDRSSCKLTVTCKNDFSHGTTDLNMSVKQTNYVAPTCANYGSKTFTASYTYDGKLYTSEKTIIIDEVDPSMHDYIPTFTWNDDLSACSLDLVCKDNKDHKIQNIETTISETILNATCSKEGLKTITASYTDSISNKTYEDKKEIKLEKLDHIYTNDIINSGTLKSAATYDSPAIYYTSCSKCGALGTETFTYGEKLTKPVADVTVSYHTHIQTLGDTQGIKSNGEMAGTSGMAKRLENIWIKVDGNSNLGIQYTTHCQSYGWMPWSANGEANGTSGEAKRLEAIKIKLTGNDASLYDVYYRVHAQSYGWLGWAKNGEPSGTAGYAKRLEGIQVVIMKKGSPAPGLNYAGINAEQMVHNSNPYIAKTTGTITIPGYDYAPNISYQTHVQSIGWQVWKYNGEMSGTSGMAKRLEGINIKLSNCPYSGGIEYKTHIQSFGWESTWRRDGQISGTSGKAKRLEAIQIRLTGEMANHYDVYYRVHAQSFGWLNWASNGEEAGTAGLAKRLEGIQIVLVPKGNPAPQKTLMNITSIQNQAYIKK